MVNYFENLTSPLLQLESRTNRERDHIIVFCYNLHIVFATLTQDSYWSWTYIWLHCIIWRVVYFNPSCHFFVLVLIFDHENNNNNNNNFELPKNNDDKPHQNWHKRERNSPITNKNKKKKTTFKLLWRPITRI